MLITEFDPQVHHVLEHDIIRYCKDNCPDDFLRARLFLYRHGKHETFVIAAWINEGHTHFGDLFNIGKDIRNFDRVAAMNFFRNIGEPYTIEQTKKDMANANRQAIREAEERQEQHHELETKMREATGYEAPDPILRSL